MASGSAVERRIAETDPIGVAASSPATVQGSLNTSASSAVLTLLQAARYLEDEAASLLSFCMLPTSILAARLKVDPVAREALANLAVLDGTTSPGQLRQDRLRTIHAQYQMTALALLETALYQTEERLTDRQNAEIALHVGRVGLSILRGILADKDRIAKEKRSNAAMSLHCKRSVGPSPLVDGRSPKRQKLADMRRSSSMRADLPSMAAPSGNDSPIINDKEVRAMKVQDQHTRAVLRRVERTLSKGVR